MSKDNSNGFRNNRLNNPTEEETNTSFVRKVKSRVSGLIPSSLSKWFGSEGSSKAVVRLREEDEDEEEQMQPPVKRPKLPSSSPINSYTSSPEHFLPPSAGPSRNLFIRDESVAGPSGINHGLYNGEDKDSDSGDSTSGYSSIVKVVAPCDSKKDPYDITNVINSNQLFNSSNFGHNRSLFMDTSSSSHVNTSLGSRRPSFNASTFGSPSFVDRTLATQRIMNSPFYNGCTMYGGASAYTRPAKPKVQVKPINETTQNVNHSATLSKTARRILDTLEQYATDVNRIPHPLNDKKPALLKYTGANPYIIREHKVSNTELQVPTVSELLKMKLKERLQDSTVKVRQIASTSKSAQDEYKTSKHTNKIKNKISSIRKKPDEVALAPKTTLPDIQLPITTLPKFDLSFPLPSSNVSKPITVVCSEKTKTPEVVKPIVPTVKSKMPQKLEVATMSLQQEHLEFQFADPLVLADNLKSIIAINDFKFSEPIIFSKVKSADGFNLKLKNNTTVKILENIDLAKFKPPSDTWECSSCLLRNLSDKSKCVACEAPRRTEEISRKVAFGSEFKMSGDKWECESCMLRNLNKDSSCVACLTPRQKLNGPINTFGNKFKPPTSTWECRTCLIRNKDDLVACNACGTPNAGVPPPKVGIPTVKPLDMFKMKSNEWECSICMVRNSADKIKCAACETPKIGAPAPALAPLKQLDIFKLKTNEWECSACMVRNSVDKIKCAACETPKTNTQSEETKVAPQFTFGILPNTKTLSTGFVPAEVKDDKSSAPTFNFGIKNIDANTNKTPAPFLFGNKPDENKNEAPKPAFTFGIKTNTVEKEIEKQTNIEVPKPTVTTSSNEPKTEPMVPPSETKPQFKLTAPTTPFGSLPALSVSKASTEAPFKFGSPSQVPKTSVDTFVANTTAAVFGGTTIPAKSLFETETIELPQITAPIFDMQPKPTVKTFEEPAPFKPATFETPTTVFNVTPAFSFGGPPGGFAFGPSKSTESEQPTNSFGFGAPSSGGFGFPTPAAHPVSMPGFNFNAPKEQSPFQTNTQPATNIFAAEPTLPTAQPVAPLQNGLFSFGGAPAKSGFSFGATSQQFNAPAPNPTPGIFSFGTSQPNSTMATGGFNFGTTTTPTFNADFKPTFNFTGGATPSFSALPSNESPAVAQRRKIRAVRRNPQR